MLDAQLVPTHRTPSAALPGAHFVSRAHESGTSFHRKKNEQESGISCNLQMVGMHGELQIRVKINAQQ